MTRLPFWFMKLLHEGKLSLVLKIRQNIPHFPLLPPSWAVGRELHLAAREVLLLWQDVHVWPFAVTYVPLFVGTSLYISRTTPLNQNPVTQALRQDALQATWLYASKKRELRETKGSEKKKLCPGIKDNKEQYKMKSNSNTELKWRMKEGTEVGLEVSQKLS